MGFIKQRLKILSIFSIYLLLTSLLGCEAFARKFIRKPKKQEQVVPEMVLVPQEYNNEGLSKVELYRKYFLFWKAWHDELIDSLYYGKSQKKHLDCLGEIIKNLNNLKSLLDQSRQDKLDGYISELEKLNGMILEDVYGINNRSYADTAARIKREILRYFSYAKVKDFLL